GGSEVTFFALVRLEDPVTAARGADTARGTLVGSPGLVGVDIETVVAILAAIFDAVAAELVGAVVRVVRADIEAGVVAARGHTAAVRGAVSVVADFASGDDAVATPGVAGRAGGDEALESEAEVRIIRSSFRVEEDDLIDIALLDVE